MKLLATADIHIGRRPQRVPARLGEQYSCAQVWARIVEEAIAREVDAVLLAGDVVDEDNRFFEAIGPLETGIESLAKAGIAVCAVAGNHDCLVLPALAERLGERFRLLGRHGQWERCLLTGRDGQPVQLFGWSFRAAAVTASPLATFPVDQVDDALPALGLLHADVGVASSSYAPVARTEFGTTGVPLWILGHVHKPGDPNAGPLPRVFYTGSPQGVDPGPGEQGLHGPWLLTWSAGWRAEHLPIAAVRYEELTVAIEGDTDPAEVQTRVHGGLAKAAGDWQRQQEALRVVALRLTIAGETRLPPAVIEAQLAELIEQPLTLGGVTLAVDRITVDARPPLDLAALAEKATMLGELARLVKTLESDAPLPAEQQALVEQALDRSRQLAAKPVFRPLADDPQHALPDTDAMRALLARQGWRLLQRLTEER